jgi:hypothetical protein
LILNLDDSTSECWFSFNFRCLDQASTERSGRVLMMLHISFRKFKRVPLAWLGLAMAFGLVACTHLSDEPQATTVDRDVQLVSLVPADGGGSHINIAWLSTVDTADPSTPVNLATDIVVKVNGREVDRILLDTSFAGETKTCANDCASCTATCFVGVPGHGCACGSLRSTFSSPQPVQPGDELEVSLIAARGGQPDENPAGSRVTATVGEKAILWQAEVIAICPGALPGLGLDGVVRPASSVLVSNQTPSTVHCDGNTGRNCLDVWRACRDEGRYTDCVPVQTPGGGTNGASCNCGAERPSS